jgi:hypothetical protein
MITGFSDGAVTKPTPAGNGGLGDSGSQNCGFPKLSHTKNLADLLIFT